MIEEKYSVALTAQVFIVDLSIIKGFPTRKERSQPMTHSSSTTLGFT
jgi:hypothetical protein